MINLDDKKNKGTHWVSFFIDRNATVVLNKIIDKLITHKIFRKQDDESIMCECYCVSFIEYVLAGKTLLGYTNLFSPNEYKQNDKIINKYLKEKCGRRSES